MKLATATWYLARYDLIVLILGGGIFKLYWVNSHGEIKASGTLSECFTLLEVPHGKEMPEFFSGKTAGELLFAFKRAISIPAVIGKNLNKTLGSAMRKLSDNAI